MKKYFVYILKCSDGSYYTGYTSDIGRRVNEHNFEKYNGYTSSRLPVTVVFHQEFSNLDEAIRAEKQIKGWSRKKKEGLINGNFDILKKLSECKNTSSHKHRQN